MQNAITNYLQSTTASMARLDPNNIEKGESLKFTERWATRSGAPLQVEKPLLVLFPPGAITGFRYLRKWEPAPVEAIVPDADGNLPDPDELNKQFPVEQWAIGLDGKPRPPWSKYLLLYLLDTSTAALYNFTNNTIGTRMMISAIEDRTRWGRALFGDDVMPLVKLTDRTLTTKFGDRRAPALDVLGFRRFGDGGVLRIVDQRASPGLLRDVGPPPPAKDMMGDEVPF
jgi:hypothetical protein